MTSTGPILIAYDGSDDAQHAIDHVAALLRGADAAVLYVRQPLESLAAHVDGRSELEDVHAIDEGSRDGAERLAAEGAERARLTRLDLRTVAVSGERAPYVHRNKSCATLRIGVR